MSALSIEVPFPVFQDRDGQPLENGYVWLGVANLNPQTNPVIAYFDKALTIPAAQPLRTINGYISNAGTPAQVYVNGVSFSILVQDSKGSMVYNFPDGTGISPDACGVTYNPPFTGGVPYPVCEKLEQTISVEDFGAVGDGVTNDTAAIQACFDYCRDNDLPWSMNGNYVADGLICYTSGEANGSTLIATNSGQTGAVLTVQYKATDRNSNDTGLLSAFNAALPLQKNTSVIPSLGAFKGKSIRLASTTPYIVRIGSATDYRNEIFFDVLDAEGNIYPPLPYNIGVITFTAGVSTTITKPTYINNLNIGVTGGSATRTSVFIVSKPNVIINNLSIKNNTLTPIQVGAFVFFTTDVTFNDLRVDGLLEVSTNYGINATGANININNAYIFGCRRGFDGSYANTITIIGGSFPDGIGAHLAFNGTIIGTYISADPPNASPIFWSGGDLTLDSCKILTNTIHLCQSRQDVPEFIGNFKLTNSELIFNNSTSTGTSTCSVFNQDYRVIAFDPGRDISAPDSVIITGNSISVSGVSHTNRLAFYSIEDNIANLNPARTFVTGTQVIADNNSIKFENNLPIVLQAINKQTFFTGTGFNISIKNVPEFIGFFGNPSGVATTTARSNLVVESFGPVDIRVDGGGLESYFANGTDFSTLPAVGTSTLLDDEQFWYSINNSAFKRLVSIADNSVFIFPSEIFTAYNIYQANGNVVAKWCDIIVDLAGALGITIKNNDALTTWNTLVIALNGTTGPAASMNLSVFGGKVYIENRTGGTLSFLIARE
jgi:hypothetical protein